MLMNRQHTDKWEFAKPWTFGRLDSSLEQFLHRLQRDQQRRAVTNGAWLQVDSQKWKCQEVKMERKKKKKMKKDLDHLALVL
jgi:hypothetical protein